MVSLLLEKGNHWQICFCKKMTWKKEGVWFLKAVAWEDVKSPKRDFVPLLCGADQFPLSALGPGWGGKAGGAQRGDRIPRGRQLPEPEAQQEDHDVAGGFAERVLPSAASNAKGVHHTLSLWSVSTAGKGSGGWDGESLVLLAGSGAGRGQLRWCGGRVYPCYPFPILWSPCNSWPI